MSVAKPAVSRPLAAPRRLAAVLVFLAVQSTAVASLGTPLLPTVQHVEHVSLAASQWTLTITLLAGAVVTPLMGRLGDGRLRGVPGRPGAAGRRARPGAAGHRGRPR